MDDVFGVYANNDRLFSPIAWVVLGSITILIDQPRYGFRCDVETLVFAHNSLKTPFWFQNGVFLLRSNTNVKDNCFLL